MNKIAEGREAEIFVLPGERVLKLFRSHEFGHLAESHALAALSSLGGPVPRFEEFVMVDGRPGLVMQRVGGSSMMELIERRPLRLSSLGRRLADIHTEIHRIRAPSNLPAQKDQLRQRLGHPRIPPDLSDFALSLLDDLPESDSLCHGDFHPGNILVSSSDAWVIDWPNATRGDPAADHARTMWLLRSARLPSGMSMRLRGVIIAGRTAFARLYARRYARLNAPSREHVQAWSIVHAAARLSEGVDVEVDKITSFLETRRSEYESR